MFLSCPLTFVFLSCRQNYPGTQKRVRISHGKWVIDVRIIEVLLSLSLSVSLCLSLSLSLSLCVLKQFRYCSSSLLMHRWFHITKTSLFKNTENFTTKTWKISDKILIFFKFLLGEAVVTRTHNLCFWAEIRKTMYTPVNPSFTV